jgi:hypothetical protein
MSKRNMAKDPNLGFLDAILYPEQEQVENDFGCHCELEIEGWH